MKTRYQMKKFHGRNKGVSLPRGDRSNELYSTIEILKSIRDEIRTLRHDTNERFESLERTTNERFESLERRQTETEIRLATELMAVVGAVNQVRDLLTDRLDLGDTVKDHEQQIIVLEARVEG